MKPASAVQKESPWLNKLMNWFSSQEFNPKDFYNQLDEEGRVLEKIPDKSDITSYVKVKLGLVQAEELSPDSPKVQELSFFSGEICTKSVPITLRQG